MTQRNFDDGAKEAYAELPVPVNGLSWRRGDSKLSALKDTDKAQYFGGWRGFVLNKLGEKKPEIALPIVTREGDKGNTYQVYSFPYIHFLPITSRLRYELREKYKDENGNERTRIVAVKQKQTKGDGYEPNRQVFGLVFDRENPEIHTPVLLYIDNWSAFISYGNAGTAWKKIKAQPNTVVIRVYGTQGEKVKSADGAEKWIPKFQEHNGGKSTPIEALGLTSPKFFVITDELNTLYDGAQDWANCLRWNAVGEVEPEKDLSVKELFLARTLELGMSADEVAQCLASCEGDYAKAYTDIQAVTGQDDGSDDFPF